MYIPVCDNYVSSLYSLLYFVCLWTWECIIALHAWTLELALTDYNILAHISCGNGEYNNTVYITMWLFVTYSNYFKIVSIVTSLDLRNGLI